MMRRLMSIMLATFFAMGINGFAEAATSGGKNTALSMCRRKQIGNELAQNLSL